MTSNIKIENKYKNLIENNSGNKYLTFDKVGKKIFIHFMDKDGYKFRVVSNSFRTRIKDHTIGFRIVGGNNPYSEENAKRYVETNSNFLFIGLSWGNKKIIFDLEDDEGYRYRVTKTNFDGFLKGSQDNFNKVGSTQYYSVWNINRFLELNGIKTKLDHLEGEIEQKKKYKFVCSCERKFMTSWESILYKDEYECDICRLGEERNEQILWNDINLKEYVNEKTNLIYLKMERVNIGSQKIPYVHFQDETGYKYKISKYSIDSYINEELSFFKKIDKNNPYSIENIQLYLRINNKPFTVVSNKFNGGEKKLLFKCSTHGGFYSSWARLSMGLDCMGCYYEERKTEIKPLSEDEKNYNRMYPEYFVWKAGVFKRDGYKCICCEETDEIVAHHLDGYSWAVDKRTDVNNGVTLCQSCHITFHKTYGYRNNNKDQFKEFFSNYTKVNTLQNGYKGLYFDYK